MIDHHFLLSFFFEKKIIQSALLRERSWGRRLFRTGQRAEQGQQAAVEFTHL
ncbi:MULTISPECIES: hypothetical protein [unclassified Deinococcus]|uniref:hypothetical protein n=1 Tax=unclassified Deinococcus TaxID=2623546 RepID=UPI001E294BB3|nr:MULTISPECIES: hypothetical protein [unclassified Deinococcus]MCD0155766.1 hypothetical protein [Deinococcus sp. 6GRE01]MCD0161247.1 hypothetical protein [Deinococcus sp. 6YEL10]MCD0169387.1 hypothetical protein [Deinococcus sp. 23YEL01]